ncbi:MAG: rRNA maturation RNase YbeY [Gemmatimonas sp.]|nr:rRNA maturation RNase YbeY [Gemmatimonas sp.]
MMTDWQIEVGAEADGTDAALLEDLTSVARWTLSGEEVDEIDLSIALMSDRSIAQLNQRYLSHEEPTDVISFPLDQIGERKAGDVYVGVEQAERQAAELGIPLREELLRLVVHGTLHILGWDHPDDERDESPMYHRQEELLRTFLERS